MTAGSDDNDQVRQDEAADWFARLSADDASLEDWRAHHAWLAADASNVAAYARVEALWAELDDRAEALKRALDGDPGVVVPMRARPTRRSPAPAWRWAAAAAVVATAGWGLVAYRQAQPTTYETAAGHTRALALEDGSRIVMNGASRLSVRYERGARRVTLADAEADFDIAHDAARPFVISAGDERISVLGTAFDVVSHAGALTVTVRRGLVSVGPAQSDAVAVQVPAGSRFERRPDGTTLVTQVDPTEAIAWRKGQLVSHGERLVDVAAALSRAFPTPVEVTGPARDLTFTGVLVLDQENAVLRRLEAFLPVDARRSGGAVVISSRP